MAAKIEEVNEISAVFDDTLLIKSYDNSVNMTKEELAIRIASSTNSQYETGNEEISASTNPPEFSGEYVVGDFVRATYEDGIDYEAKILTIDTEAGTCLLKYIGYENEQEIVIKNLIPSWGKEAQDKQVIAAKESEEPKEEQQEAAVKSVAGKSAAGKSGEGKPERNDERKSQKKPNNSANIMHGLKNFPNLPPPPPMPPILWDGKDKANADQLNAMLWSWYMSGYYTGIYQGMNVAKKTKKESQKKTGK